VVGLLHALKKVWRGYSYEKREPRREAGRGIPHTPTLMGGPRNPLYEPNRDRMCLYIKPGEGSAIFLEGKT